jgi:penicillin amidase
MYLGASNQRPRRGVFWRRLLLILVLLLITALSVLVLYFLSTKNHLDSEVITPGISAPVTIKFDEHALPHVFASSQEDAWHTLGFLHATERPWQMEFNRRLASGKLSEILGKDTLVIDKFMRTLGIRRAAEKQYENYPIEYKRYIQAYVDGVNEGLTRLGWALPPEFMILGVKPGSWGPADSVAWSLMMALDLGGNWHKEFLRLEMSATLSTEQIWQVLPPYPGEAPASSVDFAKMYRELGLFKEKTSPITKSSAANTEFEKVQIQNQKEFLKFLPGGSEGIGSNNWVVGGGKTVSGKPLLANDPHLGLTTPAIWYFAHIQTPKLNVIGATLPGIPGVVLGHNTHVAWSFTNTDPDVQDLYIEALDPSNPGRYKTPQGYENFILREEAIAIKGKEPFKFLTRETRHGPVISDAYERAQDLIHTDKFAISLRWTALETSNQTLKAGFQMNEAQSLNEFMSALKNYHAPMQNVVMADKDGQIAYRAAGVAPKRTKGKGLFGTAPGLGWDAQYDWGPYFGKDELPKETNPSSSFIATANQRVHTANDPHPLTTDWHMPYRQQRIEQLINATEQHDMASMKAIQADALSLSAVDLIPLLQAANSTNRYANDAKTIIGNFDGKMSLDSAGATIYNAWAHQLTRLMFADKLGKSFSIEYGKRDFRAGLHHIMKMHQADDVQAAFWCDKPNTPEIETCETLIDEAFTLALEDLSKRMGGSPQSWKWGEVHVAVSEHRPFSKVSLLKNKFEITRPTPGDAFTLNLGFMDLGNSSNPFTVNKAASMRAIYDLSNLDQSQFIYQTGQSGWVNDRHYSSYANAWAKQEYLPLTMNPSKIVHTSVLKPDLSIAAANKKRLEKEAKEIKRK